MDTYETRLRQRLLRLSAAAPSATPPDLPSTRVPARLLLMGAIAGCAVLLAVTIGLPHLWRPTLAVVSVAGAQIAHDPTATWSMTVSRAQAEQTALDKVGSFDPSVTDLRVTSVRQVAGVFTVEDLDGQRVFSSSDPVNAWVFAISGKSSRFERATGVVLIDAQNGKVIAADLLQTNE
jgi:hypothetical protein